MSMMATNITNKNHSRLKKSPIRFIKIKAEKILCFCQIVQIQRQNDWYLIIRYLQKVQMDKFPKNVLLSHNGNRITN